MSGSRRGHGEGSIFKRGDGRWAGIVDLGYQRGRRNRQTFYGKTRKEVAEKLAAAQRAQKIGLPIGDGHQTLAQFLNHWLETVRPTLRPNTWKRYEQYVRRHVLPEIGPVRLAHLSPQHLETLYADRLAAGMSPTTVGHLHRVIHRALSSAERLQLVPRNVAKLVDPPRPEPHEIRPLSPDQARHLLEVANGTPFEALFVLALATGMREGEILALKWSDIDLQRRRATVRGTLQRRDGVGLVVAETKTASSRRQVALSNTATAALRRHRRNDVERSLRLGIALSEDDFVFTSKSGGPIDPQNLRARVFQPLLKRAGLPAIRFHDLRHTAATLLLGKGVHAKIVSEMLGHSNISITLNLYSHVTPIMHEEAADALDEVLAGTH
jgi:integrase